MIKIDMARKIICFSLRCTFLKWLIAIFFQLRRFTYDSAFRVASRVVAAVAKVRAALQRNA